MADIDLSWAKDLADKYLDFAERIDIYFPGKDGHEDKDYGKDYDKDHGKDYDKDHGKDKDHGGYTDVNTDVSIINKVDVDNKVDSGGKGSEVDVNTNVVLLNYVDVDTQVSGHGDSSVNTDVTIVNSVNVTNDVWH